MFQVFIDKPSLYEPDMAGEFKELAKAIEFAEKEKAADSEITYTIEETNGSKFRFLICIISRNLFI